MSDSDGFGRDNSGRWKKGFCPNPKGRPRNQPEISDSDVGHFKQRVVEVMINGEKRQLSRHELLLHSMYEQAIKGKSVNLARKLFDRFEDVDLMRRRRTRCCTKTAKLFWKIIMNATSSTTSAPRS